MSLQLISSPFVFGDKFGYREAEKLRQSIVSIAALRVDKPLTQGGARSDRHLLAATGTYYDHPNYWDARIDWTQMAAGWTVVARLNIITESGGTVQCSIRNVTDAADITGTSQGSTSWFEDLITIPAPGVLGVKYYRLQFKSNSTTLGLNALGVIEIYG